MPIVQRDLPCIRCGYNLRALPRDGRCSECGLAVDATYQAEWDRQRPLDRLRQRPLHWLLAVRDSHRISFAAWIAFLCDAFLSGAEGPIPLSVAAVMITFWCWAWWRLFTPERLWLTWLGRAAVVFTLLGTAGSGLNSRWANYYFVRPGPLPWPLGDGFFVAAAAIAEGTGYAIWLTVVLALLSIYRCCWLARRYGLLVTTLILTVPCAVVIFSETMIPRSSRFDFPWQVLNFLLFTLALWMPILFALLAHTFTRAIQLAQSPAANSPP